MKEKRTKDHIYLKLNLKRVVLAISYNKIIDISCEKQHIALLWLDLYAFICYTLFIVFNFYIKN